MLHYPLQLTSHLSTTYSSLTKCVFGHVDHLQGWGGHCSLRQPVTIFQGFVRNHLLIMRQSVSSWSFCPLVFLFFLFHRGNSLNIWRWISCSLQIIAVQSESSLVPPDHFLYDNTVNSFTFIWTTLSPSESTVPLQYGQAAHQEEQKHILFEYWVLRTMSSSQLWGYGHKCCNSYYYWRIDIVPKEENTFATCCHVGFFPIIPQLGLRPQSWVILCQVTHPAACVQEVVWCNYTQRTKYDERWSASQGGVNISIPALNNLMGGGSKRITSKGWGRLQEEGLVTHSSTGHLLPSSRSFHRNVLQLLLEKALAFSVPSTTLKSLDSTHQTHTHLVIKTEDAWRYTPASSLFIQMTLGNSLNLSLPQFL